MLVYPEIESWDEFYPSEIFVSYGENDNIDEILIKAPVGSTIYLGTNAQQTSIFKKVAEAKGAEDMDKSFILIGDIAGN